MDIVFSITLMSSFFFILLLILVAIRGLKNSTTEENDDSTTSEQTNQFSSGESGLRYRGHRMNRNLQQPTREEQASDDEAEEIDFDDNDVMKEFPIKGKIGVKKQRKLEMKAEKKLVRERELQEREERKRLMEEREKQQKLEEERLEQEKKAKEEAERLEKERKEREEHELYLQLKQNFSIDEEGYDGDENEEESHNKLQMFIDYVKDKKVVHMDELAGHFNLKTPEAIQRIQALLEQELLIGVIDDRGKFIYITNDELQAVAQFIKQRGRISLTELAENSNNLIKLIPVDTVN